MLQHLPLTARPPIKPTYEAGMKITYDAKSKRVVIAFRGRISVLPGDYETEMAGQLAGENFCRQHGWVPTDPNTRQTTYRPW